MESYSTRLRTMGYGISNCVGKCFGTIAPFVFIPLYYSKEFLPFMVLSMIATINMFLVVLLPSELTQTPLDYAPSSPHTIETELEKKEDN